MKVRTEEETGKSADALNCEFITSVTIKTHNRNTGFLQLLLHYSAQFKAFFSRIQSP